MMIRIKKQITKFTPLIIILVATSVTSMLIASKREPERQPDITKNPAIEALDIDYFDVDLNINGYGNVEPKIYIDLVPEVSGVVKYLSDNYREGRFVNKGELIVAIDDTDFQVKLKHAEMELSEAQMHLKMENGSALAARKQWDKNRIKIEDHGKELYLREPMIKNAEAKLAFSRMALKAARLDLEKTRIVSPCDCIVKKRLVDLGTFIQKGTTIGGLVPVDKAEIKVSLPASDFHLLPKSVLSNEGQTESIPVQVTQLEKNSRRTWIGYLSRTENLVDSSTRSYTVVVEVDEPYAIDKQNNDSYPLYFGSFVSVRIPGIKLKHVVPVPRELLLENDNLLVINANDILEKRPIQIAYRDSENIYISEGFKEKDRLVVSGGHDSIGYKVAVVSDNTETIEQ